MEKTNDGSKLKIALVQARSAAGDVAANMRRGLEYVRAAKRAGADLVLFPECWLTGYHFPPSAPETLPEELERDELFRAWAREALTEEDPAVQAFCGLARELSIGVALTSLTQGRRRPRNSALVIGRDGDIRMRYDKVHICSFGDERCLESGEAFRVCRFDGVTLGVMICYDREYPESARELALQGAEVILVPNDCGDMAPRLMELKVRAMENMAAVAMANPPGPGMGRSCAFHPMVWDAPDQTLALAGEHSEGLVMAEIDLAALRAYREREDLGKYRRPAAYRHWGEIGLRPKSPGTSGSQEPALLSEGLDRLHTTAQGAVRIRKNLALEEGCDAAAWCRERIRRSLDRAERRGKNWYVAAEDCVITVNARSMTIITAHRKKGQRRREPGGPGTLRNK